MTRRPKTGLVLFLLALAGVVALAVVPAFIHAPPTLLRRSARVAPVGAWKPDLCNYFWLSSQRILVLRQDTPQPPDDYTAHVHATRLDLPAQTRTELTNVGAAFNAPGAQSSVADWQLSPDKKWLLGAQSLNTTHPQWVAVLVSSGSAVHCPGDDQVNSEAADIRPQAPWVDVNPALTHLLWNPDSRSWLHLVVENNGGAVNVSGLHTAQSTSHPVDFMPQGRIVLGFVAPGRVLSVYNHTGDGGGIGFVDFPASGVGPVSNYYQHIPPNMDVREATLSPDGTRLAWKFAVKPLPFGLEATRNSSYVRHSSPTTVGLWVSKLDCSGLQEIGTVDARDDSLSDLRWTPDGTRLSFIYGNALYTVPAT